MTVIVILLAFAAAPIADARWLRVAQREHYLPGEVTRFAVRWWTLDRRNQLLLVSALAGVAVSVVNGWAAIVPVQIAALGPLGLSMRGRTSPLATTTSPFHNTGTVVTCVRGDEPTDVQRSVIVWYASDSVEKPGCSSLS